MAWLVIRALSNRASTSDRAICPAYPPSSHEWHKKQAKQPSSSRAFKAAPLPSQYRFECAHTVVAVSLWQIPGKLSVQSWPRAARRIGVERGPLAFKLALRFGAVRWCDCTESMPVLGIGEVRLNGVRASAFPGFMGERFISHRQYSPCYDSANLNRRIDGLA